MKKSQKISEKKGKKLRGTNNNKRQLENGEEKDANISDDQ